MARKKFNVKVPESTHCYFTINVKEFKKILNLILSAKKNYKFVKKKML